VLRWYPAVIILEGKIICRYLVESGGATKTESVSERSPLVNNLARVFGYELRQCSRCRRLRLLKRHAGHRQHHRPPNDTQVAGPGSGANERAAQEVSEPAARASAGPGTEHRSVDSAEPEGLARCPRCGGNQYRRSHRRKLERLLHRPPMARCKACRFRFPLP